MELKGSSCAEHPTTQRATSTSQKTKIQSSVSTPQANTFHSVPEVREESRNRSPEEIEDSSKANSTTSKHVQVHSTNMSDENHQLLTDDIFEQILNNDALRKVDTLSISELKPCCRSIFESLAVKSAGELCRETMQSQESWKKARELRISGSRVYNIYTYTRNRSPDWEQKSKKFFWSIEFTNVYLRHGIGYEQLARETYEYEMNVKVVECGFIVHPDHRWIGYSPDGLIFGKSGPEKLIEIKCVYTGKSRSIAECLSSCKFLDKDGRLRKKHTYYGQVQLGMLLCNVKTCDFIVFASSDESIHVISVPFDEEFAIEMFVVVQNAYVKEMLHYVCLNKNQEQYEK